MALQTVRPDMWRVYEQGKEHVFQAWAEADKPKVRRYRSKLQVVF